MLLCRTAASHLRVGNTSAPGPRIAFRFASRVRGCGASSPSLRRNGRDADAFVETLIGERELALPLRHGRGCDAVAEHVRRRTAHIEELVDADNEQQSGF